MRPPRYASMAVRRAAFASAISRSLASIIARASALVACGPGGQAAERVLLLHPGLLHPGGQGAFGDGQVGRVWFLLLHAVRRTDCSASRRRRCMSVPRRKTASSTPTSIAAAATGHPSITQDMIVPDTLPSSPKITRLTPGLVLLLASVAGLSVANLYYNQPILGLIAQSFAVPGCIGGPDCGGNADRLRDRARAGSCPWATCLNRRRLILWQAAGLVVALVAAAAAPKPVRSAGGVGRHRHYRHDRAANHPDRRRTGRSREARAHGLAWS